MMTNQVNGWIIQANKVKGCVTIFPVNNDEVSQCLIQSDKVNPVANIHIINTKGKILGQKHGVTILNYEEVAIMKVSNK